MWRDNICLIISFLNVIMKGGEGKVNIKKFI